MKNKELILIDASWVIHRMWYVHQDLSVTLHCGEVLKSGHLYGVARLLKSLNEKYPEADIIFCLDGVAKHGKDLNPEYKANRGESAVRTAFDDLGVLVECAVAFDRTKVAFHRALEADEVISYFVHLLHNDYEKVIVYSADGDMLQLLAVGDNVFVAKEFERSGKLKLVDVQTYETDQKYVDKFAGVAVGVLPIYRAMVGDGSDNLSGFPRIRKKLAKQLAEKYPTPQALIEGCESGDELFPKGFEGFLGKFKNNYDIMKLPSDLDLIGRHEIPHEYYREGSNQAPMMFSLYRIRSASPVETVEVVAEDEGVFLALRDAMNDNWRHPNSVPKV